MYGPPLKEIAIVYFWSLWWLVAWVGDWGFGHWVDYQVGNVAKHSPTGGIYQAMSPLYDALVWINSRRRHHNTYHSSIPPPLLAWMTGQGHYQGIVYSATVATSGSHITTVDTVQHSATQCNTVQHSTTCSLSDMWNTCCDCSSVLRGTIKQGGISTWSRSIRSTGQRQRSGGVIDINPGIYTKLATTQTRIYMHLHLPLTSIVIVIDASHHCLS